MLYTPDCERFFLDEQRRLLRELGAQRMSWRKIGKLLKLGALLRMNAR
jgi:hypothetical protein